MKNIIKLLSIVLVLIAFACEPDEYAKPDIDLVPVFTISETGDNSMSIIRIYQEQNLLTIADKDGIVRALKTSSYVLDTAGVNKNITITAVEKVTEQRTIAVKVLDEEGNILVNGDGNTITKDEEIDVDVEYTYNYNIDGTKESNNVAVSIEYTAVVSSEEYDLVSYGVDVDLSGTILMSGIMDEEEVYN